MADIEIERKYLLMPCIADDLLTSWGILYKKEHLEQFYVPTEASPYTRYRKKGSTYYITIKSGEGMVRQEIENEVPEDEYLHYRTMSTGRIISKERYTFEYEDNTYELDTFHETLEGLCYLEIEFNNEEKAKSFALPDLFKPLLVTEVTFDKNFNNSALANAKILPTPKLEPVYSDLQKHIVKISPFLSVDKTLTSMIYNISKEIQRHRKILLKDPGEVEELHQFRVSLRKLRALLKEFKDFFDHEWYQKHNKRLSLLMKYTNDKRDNDVAMIDIGTLRKELPSGKDKTLNALKNSLQKKNKILEEKLIKFLKSNTLKEELKLFAKLTERVEVFTQSASQPLILMSISIINTRIETIINEAEHICKRTEYDIYHNLRIQFKKLRYIIESLSPIIQQEKLKVALNKLKKVQAILGDINDFHVQEKKIKKFRKSQKKDKGASLKKLQGKMRDIEEENKIAFHDIITQFKEDRLFYQTLLYRSEPITL